MVGERRVEDRLLRRGACAVGSTRIRRVCTRRVAAPPPLEASCVASRLLLSVKSRPYAGLAL